MLINARLSNYSDVILRYWKIYSFFWTNLFVMMHIIYVFLKMWHKKSSAVIISTQLKYSLFCKGNKLLDFHTQYLTLLTFIEVVLLSRKNIYCLFNINQFHFVNNHFKTFQTPRVRCWFRKYYHCYLHLHHFMFGKSMIMTFVCKHELYEECW